MRSVHWVKLQATSGQEKQFIAAEYICLVWFPSACQSGGIHKPVTASGDKLQQQAVRCQALLSVDSLPSHSPLSHALALPLPVCLSPCPVVCRPRPPSPYWCGFRCCCSLWWYSFDFLLDPLATGTKGEVAACGAAPAPAAWGAKGRKVGTLHPHLPARQWAFGHFARNAFELLPDPIVCSANGVQRPAQLDAQCLRGGENGSLSPPWRSISNLLCAMIIWILDYASLPSSAHHLPYFPLIVPGISGSDMEAFQRGATRQDSSWGEEGCAFGLLMWDCTLPPPTCSCNMIYQLVVNGAYAQQWCAFFLALVYLHFFICLHLKFQHP